MAGSAERSPRGGSRRPPGGPLDGLRAVGQRIRERPTTLLLLVTGALLIAIGAGPSPGEGAWTGLPPAGLIRWVVGVVVGVIALAGLVILATFRSPAPTAAPPRRRSILAGLVAPLLLALAIALLPRGEQPEPEPAGEPAPVEERDRSLDVAPPGFELGDGAALGVIVVASLMILWLLRRPRESDEVEPTVGNADDPLRSAVGRAARQLLDSSDPRDAVLLAYRDLESSLEDLDLPRHPTETPTEHLGRALRHLGIVDPEQSRPLLDLAALYARARYSDHPIGADDRRRAAEALDRAHRSLVGLR